MQTVRFGRSRWQRRAGVVASLAAGALVLASCSSGPKGVNALGPPAKAPTQAAVVKTVRFPSGPVAEHIYGPSWARFVAAFPGKVVVTNGTTSSSCAIGLRPQYDVTAGTPLTVGIPKPPSYDVLLWRCKTGGEAAGRYRAAEPGSIVTVDGVRGLAFAPVSSHYGVHKALEWMGNDIFRRSNVIYDVVEFATSPAAARAFVGSFRFDTSGYTPAR